MAKKLADFDGLWPAEKKLFAWLKAGNRDTCVISGKVPKADAAHELRIRAEFIRYLALGGCDACKPSEKGMLVAGAYIEGDGTGGATKGLDLEGCKLPGDLGLFHCYFPDLILLRGARLSSLFLNDSELRQGLSADRLEATGSVFLRDVTARGALRLVEAKLGGNLDCKGARFEVAKGVSFAADGLEATGGVFLDGVTAKGEVRLLGAKLGGDLVCMDANFDGEGGEAISLNRCTVAGALFWCKGVEAKGGEAKRVEAKGIVDFTDASFGAICDDAESWPGPGDLVLDRCRYGAFVSAPVDAKARIDWLSRQDPARFGEDFWPQPYEECARVLREMGHVAAARDVLIEKERLQRAARRAKLARELAEARELRDEAPPENGVPSYKGVRPYNDRVIGAWCRLRVAQVWDGISGAVVGYGRKPLTAGVWLFGFWLLGAVVFGHAGGYGAMKPNLPQVQRAAEWANCRDGGKLRAGFATQYHCYRAQPEALSYPQFNALIYSADVLLPVVSLEMQSYWLPDDNTSIGAWVRWYLWFQIAVGWGLSLLAVAGFSGLIKQDGK